MGEDEGINCDPEGPRVKEGQDNGKQAAPEQPLVAGEDAGDQNVPEEPLPIRESEDDRNASEENFVTEKKDKEK